MGDGIKYSIEEENNEFYISQLEKYSYKTPKQILELVKSLENALYQLNKSGLILSRVQFYQIDEIVKAIEKFKKDTDVKYKCQY